MKGGGHVFLGHAGEQVEPERPWTATKGLKRPNNSPDKPPDDDDDRRPRPSRAAGPTSMRCWRCTIDSAAEAPFHTLWD